MSADRPPASEDDWTQSYLDGKWHEIEGHLSAAMDALREIWPEMTATLPETGGNHISRCLDSTETAYEKIHEAGPHVLGSSSYSTYMASRTEARVERNT